MGTMLEDLRMELKVAARTLARAPGFAFAVVAILALGVGANTTVFSAVRAVMLSPLPFERADELVLVDLADSSLVEPAGPIVRPWSYPKYRILESSDAELRGMAGFARRQLSLTGAGDAVLMNVEVVTPGYLDVLGVTPWVGRDFRPDDDGPEAPPVVLLSHELWAERFGSDPGVVGRSITLHGRSVVVVGVAPQGFRGLTGTARAWVPVHTAATLTTPILVRGSQVHWMRVIGRLTDASALPRLEEQLRAVGAELDDAFPREDARLVSIGATERLTEATVSPRARQALVLLLIASGLLLVTACANLAGLLTARGASRWRELAVRQALGASRWRVAGTLLTESLLLSVVGGALAVGVAHVGVAAFTSLWPLQFIYGSWNVGFLRPDAITVDAHALGYALTTSLACGLIFGLAPAILRRNRNAGAKIMGARTAGRSSGGTGIRGLVAVEVALAVVLVVGAGLLVRSLGQLQAVERGFVGGDLLTFNVVIPQASARAEEPTAFYQELVSRLAALPAVEAATVGCALPLGGHCWIGEVRRAGGTTWPQGERPGIGLNPVGDSFFQTLGIEVLQGRTFTPEDQASSPPVAVLSRAAAERLFPGEDPLGRTLEVSASVTPEGGAGATVIGVVADVLYDGPEEEVIAEAYLSHRQEEGAGALALRTRGDALDALPAVRAALSELEPDFPIYGAQSLEQTEAAVTGDTRILGGLLVTFALIALGLAAMGVWAIVAFGVSHRTREIGLRLALGARRHEVLSGMIRNDAVTIVAGLAVGLCGAWLLSSLLETLLYGVPARDPVTFAGSACILLAVGGLAAWLPARRATRLDPMDALRTE